MLDITDLCDQVHGRTQRALGDGVARCGVVFSDATATTVALTLPRFVYEDLKDAVMRCAATCDRVLFDPVQVRVAQPVYYMGEAVVSGKRMRHVRHQAGRLAAQFPDGVPSELSNAYGVFSATILSGTDLEPICASHRETVEVVSVLRRMLSALGGESAAV